MMDDPVMYYEQSKQQVRIEGQRKHSGGSQEHRTCTKNIIKGLISGFMISSKIPIEFL